MLKAAQIIERDKEKFAHLMTLEMGKTYKSALAEALKIVGPGAVRVLWAIVLSGSGSANFDGVRRDGRFDWPLLWRIPGARVWRCWFARPLSRGKEGEHYTRASVV